jgi:phosphatidylinositol alpha-1,6-mannosyltransferase
MVPAPGSSTEFGTGLRAKSARQDMRASMSQTTTKVLLSAYSLLPGMGGVARVARSLAKILAEEQQAGRVQVLGLTLGDEHVPPDLDLPIALARHSRLAFCLRAFRAGLRCHHFIYDGCHLAQVHGIPFLSHKPSLAFIHGIEIWENAKAGYVKSARRATLLIANSQYTLTKAEQLHGPLPRARVCWLGTESDELPSPQNQNRVHRPQVLIVGRMTDRYKGHRELIACWPRVAAAVPDAMLRIVGSGPDMEALKSDARQSSAAAQIVFEGFIPDSALDALYTQATVFAMPSRGEGFGLVYIEAMRHGLPVIASVHDAAPEVVQDGRTGYTVNLDRPDELPDRIIHLLKDPDIGKQLGMNGQRRWREHFCYSALRDRLQPILREFLSSQLTR